MRRCEKGEKLHFLQLSKEFFEEFSVRRLLRAPGGDTMLRIYMQAHCAALDTGGELQLHGDMEPAEEIAILIGAPDEEIPMIATTMQHCLKCGLIKTEKNETENMIVNFTLTDKFTRAWTREALERREKKAQQIAQQDAAALIETTQDQPEETEEERKKSEKKEAAKKKKAEAEALFEYLWSIYCRKEGKSSVKAATKLRLLEIGKEKCEAAVRRYNEEKRGTEKQYILMGSTFFNGRIDDWLPGTDNNTQTAAQTQKPQAPIMITDQMVDAAIYGDDLTRENWNSKKAAYMPELQAAIEKTLFG